MEGDTNQYKEVKHVIKSQNKRKLKKYLNMKYKNWNKIKHEIKKIFQ